MEENLRNSLSTTPHYYLLHSHVHVLIRTVDVPSLTLRWNPGYGHICHVKGKDVDAAHEILKNAKSVSISKSTRSFHLPVQPTQPPTHIVSIIIIIDKNIRPCRNGQNSAAIWTYSANRSEARNRTFSRTSVKLYVPPAHSLCSWLSV